MSIMSRSASAAAGGRMSGPIPAPPRSAPTPAAAFKDHPTVKPTAMLEDALLDLTDRGDIVLDPFLGSGSTLIAAASRPAASAAASKSTRSMSIVIVRRFEAATGETAVLVETGETFAEVLAARSPRADRRPDAKPLVSTRPLRGDNDVGDVSRVESQYLAVPAYLVARAPASRPSARPSRPAAGIASRRCAADAALARPNSRRLGPRRGLCRERKSPGSPPNTSTCSEVFADLKADARAAHRRKLQNPPAMIRLSNGGRIDFWSLANPISARGRRYHRVVIDEAAFAKDGDNRIGRFDDGDLGKGHQTDPLRLRRQALVCSNSAGKNPDNFFHNICTDPRYGFVEFHATTMDNPLLPKREKTKASRLGASASTRFSTI